ncbi:RNA pseudouridylate synthase domain-containing protein 1 [Phytophthora pseudosyringae]|uniref:RNA pseudouridylate synthase domain-containing protein 1 n=1 Tax=Phytophthora pseudosyringae TaxID=221518 RepID=A0A8T1V9A0_9STRA|nr:RNA pseudouridylate synthase domain-containing protein 1 [Phytophthora pseudosyringae]
MSVSSSISGASAASSSFSSANRVSVASENIGNPLVTKVRRHQSHLSGDQTLPVTANGATDGGDDDRGGPKTLDQLMLRVLSRDEHFVVLNKGPDERMDGAFDVTLEKALARDFPEVEKFRWIHQLDFATSGVLVVGANKEATATGCRLFREKQVQKEYLAVVRGHLPFNPAHSVDSAGASAKACTFSKLGLLIQDMEEMERLRNQQRGSRAHQKMPGYPRGARHGPNLFTMEQAQLLRESRGEVRGTGVGAGARELTPAELAFTKMTWHDLTKEEQNAYTEKAKADKQRFLRELSEFLSQEKVRLARKRKYECLDREDTKEANEPVAYVLDAPIIEPHRSTGVFRMLVGTETNVSAKQSTTICFVLGHAMYKGEPVTKVLLRPLNGRRHQLRLHLAHHGFPIAGDVTYGSQVDEAPRMMLHAWRIWLRGRPADRKKYGDLYFESPDPFEPIVPSEREVCTITYRKHKEAEAQAEASKGTSDQRA